MADRPTFMAGLRSVLRVEIVDSLGRLEDVPDSTTCELRLTGPGDTQLFEAALAHGAVVEFELSAGAMQVPAGTYRGEVRVQDPEADAVTEGFYVDVLPNSDIEDPALGGMP